MAEYLCVDELTRMTGKLMDDRKDWFLKPNDDDGDGDVDDDDGDDDGDDDDDDEEEEDEDET